MAHGLGENRLNLRTYVRASLVGLGGLFLGPAVWANPCVSNQPDGQACCGTSAPNCANGNMGVLESTVSPTVPLACSTNEVAYICPSGPSPAVQPPGGPGSGLGAGGGSPQSPSSNSNSPTSTSGGPTKDPITYNRTKYGPSDSNSSNNSMGMMGMSMMGMGGMGMMGGASCDVSRKADSNSPDCQATNMAATFGETAVQGLTTALNAGIQSRSANTQANAYASSGGGQAALLNATAENQILTGESQEMMGGTAMALSAYSMYRYYKHTNAASKFNSAAGADIAINNASGNASSNDTSAQKIIDNFQYNADAVKNNLGANATPDQINQLNEAQNQHKQAVQDNVAATANSAVGEQKSAASVAMMSAVMSAATGAQQLASGAATKAAGESLKNAAKNLNTGSNTSNKVFAPPTLGATGTGGTGGSNPGMISGSGVLAPSTGDPDTSSSGGDSLPDLGQGMNPNPVNTDVPDPVTPGAFQAGSPQQGGGGGGGVGGGDSTSAASDEAQGPQQAQLGPDSQGPGYASGGGGSFSGGGGAGKGAEGGPDLSALLEKFLPNSKTSQNPDGILEFGKTGPADRQPASFSVLGRDTNIFERVHDTYQEAAHAHRV